MSDWSIEPATFRLPAGALTTELRRRFLKKYWKASWQSCSNSTGVWLAFRYKHSGWSVDPVRHLIVLILGFITLPQLLALPSLLIGRDPQSKHEKYFIFFKSSPLPSWSNFSYLNKKYAIWWLILREFFEIFFQSICQKILLFLLSYVIMSRIEIEIRRARARFAHFSIKIFISCKVSVWTGKGGPWTLLWLFATQLPIYYSSATA